MKQMICSFIVRYHFIVRPFNLLEFNKEFPDIMVHKNSMGTLLYMPDLKQD